MTKFIKVVALAVLGFSLNANAIIIGTASSDTGNSYPFGSTGWEPGYQQIFDASAFAGAFDIHSLTFYNTAYDSGNYESNDGTYTIELSTTSAAVDGLSSIMSDNVGLDNTTVFVGSLNDVGAFGGSMDIILDSLFSYDPTQGNLLMQITASGVSSTRSTFFDMVDSNSDLMSRLYRSGETDSLALVTGFNEAAAIPEPASLLLIAMGIFGLRRVRRS